MNLQVAPVGGRARAKYQRNHTIPQELFRDGTEHELLELFKRMPGWEDAFDLQGNLHPADNLQPLPADPLPGGSSVHYGSHPTITEIMKDRLQGSYDKIMRDMPADVAAALNGDPAAQVRVRTAIADELRMHVKEVQFKSTNFMDVDTDAGPVRQRFVYNRRDIEYLKQTETWKNATPEQRAEALKKHGDSELFRLHNQEVNRLPITGDRALEMKVLENLGERGLAHTDGTPEARDAVRAIIAEARKRGVDLNTVDVKDFINSVENQFDEAVRPLTEQIDDLTRRIAATDSPVERALLLSERAALESQRLAVYAQQSYGDEALSVGAQFVRKTVVNLVGSSGEKFLTEAGKFLLKRIAPKLVPGLNIVSTAYDIYDGITLAHELLLTYSTSYQDLWSRMTGTPITGLAHAKNAAGQEAMALTLEQGEDLPTVVVVAVRRPNSFWEVVQVFTSNVGRVLIDASAAIGMTFFYDESERASGGGSIDFAPRGGWTRGIDARIGEDGSFTVNEYEETPVQETLDQSHVGSVSTQTSEITRLDATGTEVGREKQTIGVARQSTPEGEPGAKVNIFQLGYATLVSSLVSHLGALVHTNSPWVALGVNTVLSTVGLQLSQAIELGGLSADNLSEAIKQFDEELGISAAGAVSSYLFGELVNELGLSPLAEQALTNTGGAAVSQIARNLATNNPWNANVTVAMANAAGAFVGAYLASRLVEFDTIGGQIGASLGTTVGAGIGAVFGPIGAAVGAFIGYIVGGLIGSLFGGVPRSGANLAWDESEHSFRVMNAWAKNGASADTARSLSSAAVGVLNSVLEMTGSFLQDGRSVRVGSYGTYKKDFVYRPTTGAMAGQITFRTRDVDALLAHGTAIAMSDMLPRLQGGNVFIKRAIAATLNNAGVVANPSLPNAAGTFALETLYGNIATAQDYSAYRQNAANIDALVATEPTSEFAATWIATLAHAYDLGLHKRAATDWVGGWTVFLDEALGGRIDGEAFAPTNLTFTLTDVSRERIFGFIASDGTELGALGDTIDTASKDMISGTDGADAITVVGSRISNTAGLTINQQAATGAAFDISVAAVIDGGDGNDTITAGDLGNDLIGGEGNDTLVGGKLDDWLFGDAGDDRLFAGAANHQFSDTNSAAVAAALSTVSNGDFLDGGNGNDVIYGSLGSDWLSGGDGTDLIYGGAGADIINGGAGDDSGPNGEARLFGGAGTDQYVFGYGSDLDVIFDESDNTALPGSAAYSLTQRLRDIELGVLERNWAGGGEYESDGSVIGGEDAIVFGTGIAFQDVRIRRSGTAAAPGQDLIIELTVQDPDTGARLLTGDTLIVKDWFESGRRVEWLRFANGEDIRIGDISSFIVGTGASDVIIGTQYADMLWGGDGNDTMRGLQGNDFGFGGLGNDLVGGDEDNDFVSGGDGADKVLGDAGHDTVFGDGGDDVVYGGLGSDILAGGRGNDEVVGGAGDDIFRYERGDGRDVIFDEYVNNWDLVWQSGSYTNGYVLDTATGTVSKNGTTFFTGTEWIGFYDWANASQTFRRHLGAVNGVIAANAGNDSLEFGVGIDIQDLQLRRVGSDLEIAIGFADGDARAFDAISDRITLRDWYATGPSIENFVFAATGRHDVSTWTLAGGSDNADTLNGTVGVDWITGNAGDDSIFGNAGADILSGNGGADMISGGSGNDVLYGGDGDDVLDGGAGSDTLIGGNGTDIASYASSTTLGVRAFLNGTNSNDAAGDLYDSIEGLEGTNGDDRLGGDSGDNVLRGLGGNDTLYGGAGDDVYEFDLGHGHDTIVDAPFFTEIIVDASGALNTALYTANWTFLGTTPSPGGEFYMYQLVVTRNDTGEEVYRSREGVDFIYSSPQPEAPAAAAWPFANGQWLNGAARSGTGYQVVRDVFQSGDGGRDTLDFGPGIGLTDLTFTRLNGGADLQITYGGSNSVTIIGQSDAHRAIEALQLSDGLVADLTTLRVLGEAATNTEDLMVGDAAANTLNGLAGNDILSGLDGADTLNGGDGDDILEGGAGADRLDGGDDSVSAGLPAPSDAMSLYGDTARYVRSNAGVNVNLETGTAFGGHATGDIIVRVGGISTIENLVGSDGFNDTLTGDSRANRLAGLGGNDTIDGRGGDDVISGGAGNDILRGGDGRDSISGDDGDDTLRGGNDDDVLFGGEGVDDLSGDGGDDLLSGGDGDDFIDGGDGDDRLAGDAGMDQLFGGAGADELAGGADSDVLYGGEGDDTLNGGEGDDYLIGEDGNDDYVFDANSGNDLIIDAAGENRIVIEGVSPADIWMTRVGDDLRIAVIGGSTVITMQGYYIPNAALLHEIALRTHSAFAADAQPLIDAMTQYSLNNSIDTPTSMPAAIAELLDSYWFRFATPPPEVNDQILTTDEDTPLAGAVGATDPDDNIVSYGVQAAPQRGTLDLNTTTGTWTYTPSANLHGPDTFQIVVTDADGNSVVQNVTVNVVSVNDAPSDITLVDAATVIVERDHPPAGTLLEPVVLGTLSATDVDAPDAGDFASHVFSVQDSRFEIVNGNVLRLKAGVALDFESTPSVSVDVTVTDRNGGPGGLSFTKTFTFAVLDQDDYFYGTSGDDTLTGQSGRNYLYGFGGNDTLHGAESADVLDGGDGNDHLIAGGGDDELYGGLGDDVLDGGTGADILRGGDGVDALNGRDGDDQLFGEGGGDFLQGEAGNDLLEGGGGNDRLEGGAGDDRLVGGDSDDIMLGGPGADEFVGGAGFDTASYEVAAAGVTVDLAAGIGTGGEAAGDTFVDTPERLIGSIYADHLTGSAAGDTIDGGAGDDIIIGGAGNDTLIGGAGNDTIDAQSGDDMLIGGPGNDVLIGGAGNDTYLMNLDSGTDEIYNFDPSGDDFDVVGYENITNDRLWFERSGNDLIVTVVGTDVRTTVKDWYTIADSNERANFKIDFFIAGNRVAHTIDAESLVNLMAGYTKPTTQAEYDALHANPAFEETWRTAWKLNAPPLVPDLAAQTINEDGSLTLTIRITDDFTPAAGVTVTAQAVRPDNYNIEDLSLVYAPTLSAPTSQGDRTLTVNAKPNASGQVAIKVRAVDGGGISTEKVFLLNISPVADTPILTLLPPATPSPPLTKPTLDSGSWAVNLDASLVDQDGSETLEIRIADVPVGLTFNTGTVVETNGSYNTWSFTKAQLSGLQIQGPATWSQDLSLRITAISRESANGQTAQSSAATLGIEINARPTDIYADRPLQFNENIAAGTGLAWIGSTDGDAGDSAVYTLLNDAGGRFTLRSDGLLSTGNTILNYEAATSHTIRVRVTDSGGLTREEDFVIAVNNVNEAPTDIWADRTLQFNEGYAAGTGLAWFGGSDPDAGDSLTYSLVNSAGGRYAVRSDGLLMAGSTPTDYETATSHTITVRVTDSGGLFRDETFTIGVINVNEAPWINTTGFTVYEGTHGGPGSYLTTTTGAYAQVTGGDPENVPLTYQLIGGDTSAFSIDTAGYLHIQTALDYETRQNYSVTVRAWDGGALGVGNFVDRVIPITVANVPEGPKVTALNSLAIVDVGWPLGQMWTFRFSSVDPEGSGIVSGTMMVPGWTSGYPLIIQGSTVILDIALVNLVGMPSEVTFRLTAANGATADTQVQISLSPPGASVLGPIVLDLDGDGIELIAQPVSAVRFDMNSDGLADSTGWVGSDDAFLALDRDGDGVITHGGEISFVQDLPGAQTDLEGLAAFDTNNDGFFDAGDERFGEFRVWQDANQDGISQQSELTSLSDRGIRAINLTRKLTGETVNPALAENTLLATSEFIRSDGTFGTVGDVSLGYLGMEVSAKIIGTKEHVDRSADNDKVSRKDAFAPTVDGHRRKAATQSGNDRGEDRDEIRVQSVPEQSEEPARERANPRSWLPDTSSPDRSWEREIYVAQAPSALHTTLDSVSRRRLLMIEAMASFEGSSSASLDLQPQRRIDPRTCELLTAVSLTGTGGAL